MHVGGSKSRRAPFASPYLYTQPPDDMCTYTDILYVCIPCNVNTHIRWRARTQDEHLCVALRTQPPDESSRPNRCGGHGGAWHDGSSPSAHSPRSETSVNFAEFVFVRLRGASQYPLQMGVGVCLERRISYCSVLNHEDWQWVSQESCVWQCASEIVETG